MNKFLKSFRFAVDGVRTVWREEFNFRIEVGISASVIALGVYLGIMTIEWLFIVVAIGMVLSAEVVNTVIEDLCNKIEPKNDPVIGKIKDMMAGFVLIASLASLIIGLVIFSKYF